MHLTCAEMNENMRIRKYKPVRLIFAIFCFSLLSCSKSEPEDIPSCTDGYPKVFGNENILKSQIDVYHFNSGILTYARSIAYDLGSKDHKVTLINQSSLSETNFPLNMDYELINGCIIDNRNYQRISINENCTSITIDYLTVGVEYGIWVSGIFECGKTDETVIEDVVTYFQQSQIFDSVYIDRLNRELTLEN